MKILKTSSYKKIAGEPGTSNLNTQPGFKPTKETPKSPSKILFEKDKDTDEQKKKNWRKKKKDKSKNIYQLGIDVPATEEKED